MCLDFPADSAVTSAQNGMSPPSRFEPASTAQRQQIQNKKLGASASSLPLPPGLRRAAPYILISETLLMGGDPPAGGPGKEAAQRQGTVYSTPREMQFRKSESGTS